MKNCEQTKGQSIYEHGLSVNEYIKDLLSCLRTGSKTKEWRLPDWIDQYRELILKLILPDETISQYAIFHDCGKPFCVEKDAEGRSHFPNHANKSADTYLIHCENPSQDEVQVASLIRRDMDIHTIKAEAIPGFCENPREATTLLIAGLSEIHSNAELFGGLISTSFKIKWKQIDKRGRAILKILAERRAE